MGEADRHLQIAQAMQRAAHERTFVALYEALRILIEILAGTDKEHRGNIRTHRHCPKCGCSLLYWECVSDETLNCPDCELIYVQKPSGQCVFEE